jgi:putative transposase
MYNYRKMTEEQRKTVLRTRRINNLPLHEPFHKFDEFSKTYLISAANFEHKAIMKTEVRRQYLEEMLFSVFNKDDSKIHCWCILPNHYHILINIDLLKFKNTISKIHWKTSHQWNMEDSVSGRKVWFRFSDRAMKNESHYWASVNYVHYNPVKHGYVKKADMWVSSSFGEYLGKYGRERLVALWRKYPLNDYGKNWD